MNRIETEQYPLFKLYQSLRDQLMQVVSDENLRFSPGGENPKLGEMCREIGEIEQSYIDSFRSQRQDFDYRHPDPSIAWDVARLQQWYAQLDEDLYAAVARFSDEDLATVQIDRGGDFLVTPGVQLEIYKEALLIFYGKSAVYLKLLGIPRPPQWQHWIA